MIKKQIPQFWYAQEDKPSAIKSTLLQPFSYLYRGVSAMDKAITFTRKSPIPVICIGNLTMGGAGKTPTARTILDLVNEYGKFPTPCFLMRGYGGSYRGPIEVDPTIHTVYDVGDEALMQARYAPVILARNRYRGALLAQKLGYDIIIMDDGFQNPKLKKDLSLIVIDGGFGFGNGRVFPAGPLRETVQGGCRRAAAAIVINRQPETDMSALHDLRQFDATMRLIDGNERTENSQKVIAFTGIARPEKFFQTLEANGYHLHAHYGFPDHHIFTHGQLQKLVERAKNAGVGLITTEKDWIRLSAKWHNDISYLKISIDLPESFKSWFFRKLNHIQ